MSLREQTCCFTGHRRLPVDTDALYMALTTVVQQLAEEGIRYFGVGGALGFDELAARAVLSLRGAYPQLRLILVVPCPQWHAPWSPDDRARYARLCAQVDKVTAVSDQYEPGCMQRRNRYLVDNSAVCVAFCESDTGGAAYTLAYAQKRGLRIIRVP